MDSRLVFRPQPAVLKPGGTARGGSCVPIGQGASLPRGACVEWRGEWRLRSKQQGVARRARKAPGGAVGCPYRKPTQVGRGKYPEVDESTLVKELGKLTP